MLRTIFSPDNPVWRFFILVGKIWWLNILWLVCSLPIVTIGASTTALIYSCMKLRADEGYTTNNFFKSFKENFRQSTVLWLIYLVVGAVIGFGLIFWNHSTIPVAKIAWAVMLALAILYSISLMYVFAIQSKFVNTIKDTIIYSVLMAFANLKNTILIFMVLAGVVLANLFSVFLVNFITLNLGFAIVTYLISFHYQIVFERYIPDTDREESYLDKLERESGGNKKKRR
ncbi:MAG: YesL family protein [Eubacterium sp.]|nr:YesL family protein [Eubacterium sp.]